MKKSIKELSSKAIKNVKTIKGGNTVKPILRYTGTNL